MGGDLSQDFVHCDFHPLDDRISNDNDPDPIAFHPPLQGGHEPVTIVEIRGDVVCPSRATVGPGTSPGVPELLQDAFEPPVFKSKSEFFRIAYRLPELAEIASLETPFAARATK